ncbi:dTMP kinase [Paenibacillus dendritiformis]|uniref:dTMP kinase n=1 Tax=Paenibacillus dendritiformis TaxID=130049 RepID=UPI0018CC948C|nr:dTMP kinase [Paenibacillus dendritiformis]
MQGLFIPIEGIDASGKSTAIGTVVDRLHAEGIDAIKLSKRDFHTGSNYINNFMKQFKKIFWDYDNRDPLTEIPDEAWLFMHSLWHTLQNKHIIRPLKKQGKVILMDGWYYKIYARFLLKEQFNKMLLNHIFRELEQGDVIFWLDTSPETCWSRRNSFKKPELGEFDAYTGSAYDRFISFQGKVSQQYKQLACGENWIHVESEKLNESEVAEFITDEIIKRCHQNSMMPS